MQFYLELALPFLDRGQLCVAWTHPVCMAAMAYTPITMHELTVESTYAFEILCKRYPTLKVKYLRIRSVINPMKPLSCEYAVLLCDAVNNIQHDNVAMAIGDSSVKIERSCKNLYLLVTSRMTHIFVGKDVIIENLWVYAIYYGYNTYLIKHLKSKVGRITSNAPINNLRGFALKYNAMPTHSYAQEHEVFSKLPLWKN